MLHVVAPRNPVRCHLRTVNIARHAIDLAATIIWRRSTTTHPCEESRHRKRADHTTAMHDVECDDKYPTERRATAAKDTDLREEARSAREAIKQNAERLDSVVAVP